MPDVIQTVLPSLHQIELPTPFAVGPVNAYLFEGDPLTLIDCGLNSDRCFETLVSAVESLGHSMDEIGRLVITHHHVDHLGGAQRVVEASGAEVIAHPYTVPFLEAPLAVRERSRNYTDVAFRQGGVPQTIIDLLDQVDTYLVTLTGKVNVTCTVDEGDTLSLGEGEWQVLHTPGHAGGMICLYDPASKVIMTADHILRNVSSNPLIEAPEPGHQRPHRLLDYMRELGRVAALDTRIGYAGHGEPVTDIPGLVAQRLEHHRQRAEKIFSLFEGKPRTLYEVTRLMFPDKPDHESYLTLSEVVGHFDLLERDGRLVRNMGSNGVMTWVPVSPTVS
jgi:glyoxylase-like metal-dependent hydrolase (beta-lactamase superfamily II)